MPRRELRNRNLFDAKVGETAWKSKPSWYIVAKNDRTVHPDLERAMAKRMGATTYELDSSHVPMLSQPERVLERNPHRRKRRSRAIHSSRAVSLARVTDPRADRKSSC
jgi:pimeloyl-ACP methyl ester carboxylesterase